MIPDKLLINLKILSKIEKNGRICRSLDGVISLENNNFYQSIKRSFNGDSRKQSVHEINSIITESNDKINEISNNKIMNANSSNSQEFINNCEILLLIYKLLQSALIGIQNLKFTYNNDYNTVSQLDIIIIKGNNILKDCYNKYNFYNNLISPNYRIFDNTIENFDINLEDYNQKSSN